MSGGKRNQDKVVRLSAVAQRILTRRPIRDGNYPPSFNRLVCYHCEQPFAVCPHCGKPLDDEWSTQVYSRRGRSIRKYYCLPCAKVLGFI